MAQKHKYFGQPGWSYIRKEQYAAAQELRFKEPAVRVSINSVIKIISLLWNEKLKISFILDFGWLADLDKHF